MSSPNFIVRLRRRMRCSEPFESPKGWNVNTTPPPRLSFRPFFSFRFASRVAVDLVSYSPSLSVYLMLAVFKKNLKHGYQTLEHWLASTPNLGVYRGLLNQGVVKHLVQMHWKGSDVSGASSSSEVLKDGACVRCCLSGGSRRTGS